LSGIIVSEVTHTTWTDHRDHANAQDRHPRDYVKIALQSANWSVLQGKAKTIIFDQHLSEDEAATLLQPFDILCTVRERMSLPRSLFQRSSNLKLVTIIGMSLPNLDMAAATEHGVIVAHSNFATPSIRVSLMRPRR
jgi:phosphoglycerate dehydrogenase-like enzyme